MIKNYTIIAALLFSLPALFFQLLVPETCPKHLATPGIRWELSECWLNDWCRYNFTILILYQGC